jgi:hypothetical protein
LIEVGIGEHLALPLRALADDDVAEITGGDVGVEGLDRHAELGCGLGLGAQPGRHQRRRRLVLSGPPPRQLLGLEIESLEVHALLAGEGLDNVEKIEIEKIGVHIAKTRHGAHSTQRERVG